VRGALLIAAVLLSALATPRAFALQGAAPGATAGSLQFGGLERTYRLYVPPPADRAGPMPVVLVLHGGGGTGAGMETLTRGGLNRLADRDGFVAVYPDGVERHWNDGRGVQSYRAHRENIDDVGFISALIAHLGRRVNVDRGRVYATGISNGGLMSFRLARELTSEIAAIAPVAISMSEQIAAMRAPSRPISVLMIPGTQDPLVPWNGGEIGFAGGAKVGKALSVADAIRYWAGHNQCPSPPAVVMEPDRDPQDGTRVRRETYGPCRDGTEVVLLAVEGGGHTWPGGWQYLPERVIGRTSRDINANEVIWGFFRRHAIK
jgi:polyhydroxybutyrate depolymerase